MKIATLKRKCRIIVIDEAHKAIAKTYKSSIEFISNAETKIVGLTATPYRGDNIDENQRLVKFFNQGKVTLVSKSGDEIDNPIHYLQEKHYLARVTRKVVKTNISVDLTSAEKKFVSTFLDLPSSVLEKLANDAQRNVLILGEIAELVQNNKYIIVFALSVSHARLLSELLVMKGVEARSIDGDTDTYDREKYIQEYKDKNIQVLVNYGVLTTGFDAPNTNAVVITRPTSSLVLYSQMLGRGIRGVNMGGNSECQLVDIIDNINGFPDEKQAFTYYNSVWES
jgi:superfamily II DNA or RNA helicase